MIYSCGHDQNGKAAPKEYWSIPPESRMPQSSAECPACTRTVQYPVLPDYALLNNGQVQCEQSKLTEREKEIAIDAYWRDTTGGGQATECRANSVYAAVQAVLAKRKGDVAQQASSSDGPCSVCGFPSECWFAENDLWNKVNGGPTGLLCLRCFVRKAEAVGVDRTAWKLNLEKSDPQQQEANGGVVEKMYDAARQALGDGSGLVDSLQLHYILCAVWPVARAYCEAEMRQKTIDEASGVLACILSETNYFKHHQRTDTLIAEFRKRLRPEPKERVTVELSAGPEAIYRTDGRILAPEEIKQFIAAGLRLKTKRSRNEQIFDTARD